ncbi:MAG: hypothetical protein KJO07_03960, partial [Deltaproteobacteria bacterium]|nr:hypothetical protein [Deltaproteobacteria bacterium]
SQGEAPPQPLGRVVYKRTIFLNGAPGGERKFRWLVTTRGGTLKWRGRRRWSVDATVVTTRAERCLLVASGLRTGDFP